MCKNSKNIIPPKLAMISNLTGYGRCSLAVAIPVVSVLKVQACPAPSGLYSNHLAFPTWHHQDLTGGLQGYLEGFNNLSVKYDGIYYGFPGNETQIEIVEAFIRSQPQAKLLIDPAMGDHGKIYSSLTPDRVEAIKKLFPYTHIITPNLTEACLLAGIPYEASGWTEKKLEVLAGKIHDLGAKNVVITGVREGNCYLNFVSETIAEEGGIRLEHTFWTTPAKGNLYHGTGDLFSAVMAADMLHAVPLVKSVKKAASFVGDCIEYSDNANVDEKDGVLFEPCLHMLL